MTETRAYRITGRVQGVGFRWFTRNAATDLGIGGSVRNAGDGSVEVVARGPTDQLDKLEETLRAGPSAARVEAVQRVETPPASVETGGAGDNEFSIVR
ncbi:MAG TPA: acylphosphatase [Longimicrobiales bacterium]|nr:acylphosphatase [Longimicrobiales bacterium]